MASSDSTKLFGRSKDERGNVYDRLTVIEFADSDGTGLRWLCRCECGKTTIVRGSSLRNGHTVSCGCKSASENGLSTTPEHRIWRAMHNRCYNTNHTHYQYYGGRGIAICDRWRESFAAFLEDMGPKPFPEATIDRFPDNDGNYEPGNCKWSTRKEQSQNTRTTKMLTYNGVTLCQSDWARKLGITYQTLNWRIKQGWPLEKVFSAQHYFSPPPIKRPRQK